MTTQDAAADRVRIVNVPDVSIADDDFTHLNLRQRAEWVRLTGLPSNALEKRIRILRLSRYRAAAQAAFAARRGTMVMSHLPRMSAATAAAMRLARKRSPHLAFSFNFTDLPRGPALAYMRSVLRSVDRFAVYSQFERELYSQLFEIEADRFRPVLWTQSVPAIEQGQQPIVTGPYLCAVGAEGRDFKLLIDVAKAVSPRLKIVVIARPHSLAGLTPPDNMAVVSNISLSRVWAIAEASLGVLIPLRSPETCCGHITFVSAKQLGIPIAATRSYATTEYTAGRPAILECEAQDVDAFTRLLERLEDEQAALRQAAREAREDEIAVHHRAKWAEYVSDFIDDYG